MVNIKLTNTKIIKQIDNKIIYKPTCFDNNLKYCITFNSDSFIHIQFIIYANFIDWIEFIDYKNKSTKLEYISKEGMLISFNIDQTNDFVINFKPIDQCTQIIIKNLNNMPYQIDNLVNIKWDNIFIINLTRRSDRKEQMENKLFEANIKNFEFIEAFDGIDLQIKNKFIKLKNKKNIQIVTSGHFACLLSHIKAIKIAKIRNYSNIMILEDDVYFSNGFIDKLLNLQIPKFDMVYLGGIISKKKLFFNDWGICNKIMGAYCYLLPSHMFDVVLEHLEKLTEYVDILYIKLIQTKYKVVLLNDLVTTDLASSDTSRKSNKLVKRLNYIK
jgi:hypothetical protein